MPSRDPTCSWSCCRATDIATRRPAADAFRRPPLPSNGLYWVWSRFLKRKRTAQCPRAPRHGENCAAQSCIGAKFGRALSRPHGPRRRLCVHLGWPLAAASYISLAKGVNDHSLYGQRQRPRSRISLCVKIKTARNNNCYSHALLFSLSAAISPSPAIYATLF